MDIIEISYMWLVSIFLSFLLLTGCSKRHKEPVIYTQLLMGTIVEISVWGDEGKIVNEGFTEIKRIDNKFSFFKEDSEISKLNNSEMKNINDLSEECKYLLEEADKYSILTDGAFDVNYRPDRKYDLGGIAKGYAVDRTVQIFKDKGIERAMINIGGNLYLLGYPEGKESWDVGIKDPLKTDRLIGKLTLDKNQSVATSGNYERPGHLVNPKGDPIDDSLLSVTITAETGLEADVLSTGVFILGKEKGIELIEEQEGVEGVIVDEEGVWVSSELEDKYESLY